MRKKWVYRKERFLECSFLYRKDVIGSDCIAIKLDGKVGTVYIKELSAPAGYKVDKTVYSLKVEAGKTATLKVSDTPKVTDTLIELFKIDMETQKDNPQGNASLAGAEFTWKYYAGFYNKDNLPAEATRTWVTKTIAETDSDGTTHYITKLADAYKVSGDSLYMQAGDKSEQIKGLYLTQITEDGDLAVLSGSNQFSVRDVFLQNEDGTQSTQIKKRIYDLKCSLHGGIIPVSVPPEVSLREFPYNAVVELVNPVADTVSRKTYTGADVDWYVKAEDIVLKNKGNQNAGSPQSPTPQG